MKQAMINTIRRLRINTDGPGVRSVVFMQNCPLSCAWCCTPDTRLPGRVHTLTLQELARLLNLSVRQTQRLLRENFGKTFSQKLTEARMAAAWQYLSNTTLSVTDIAGRVGFSSVEHFSSAFRRFMGCSPRQYRQRNRAADARQLNRGDGTPGPAR